MNKAEILDFFDGVDGTASAMGLTRNAIHAWPATVSNGVRARVIGVAILAYGVRVTRKQWPDLVPA